MTSWSTISHLAGVASVARASSPRPGSTAGHRTRPVPRSPTARTARGLALRGQSAVLDLLLAGALPGRAAPVDEHEVLPPPVRYTGSTALHTCTGLTTTMTWVAGGTSTSLDGIACASSAERVAGPRQLVVGLPPAADAGARTGQRGGSAARPRFVGDQATSPPAAPTRRRVDPGAHPGHLWCRDPSPVRHRGEHAPLSMAQRGSGAGSTSSSAPSVSAMAISDTAVHFPCNLVAAMVRPLGAVRAPRSRSWRSSCPSTVVPSRPCSSGSLSRC